jgi:hypothetical protein
MAYWLTPSGGIDVDHHIVTASIFAANQRYARAGRT